MTRRALLGCGAAALLLSAYSSKAQVIRTVDAPKVVAVDGQQLQTALPLLRAFFRKHPRADCYEVLLAQADLGLEVAFIVRPGQTRCGKSIGYLLDRRGRVIRQIKIRHTNMVIEP